MPERTTVTQVVQVGAESTEGTAVAGSKKLPSLSIGPAIKTNIDSFRPLGNKFNTIHAQGKEWSVAPIAMEPTYSELEYLLASLLVDVTAVQQAATTAYKWTYAPSGTAADALKSLTVERGSSVQAEKIAGALCTDLTITGDRDKIDITGNMLGRLMSTGITLTGGPTAIEQIPILPKEVSVYLDTTSGGIGGTKLSRVLKWTIQLGNRRGPLWVVDSAQTSYVASVELPITAKVKLAVEADAAGMGLVTPLRDGTFRYLRIAAISAQLAGTAIPYSLTMDLALQMAAEPSAFQDQDGVYMLEYEFDVTFDSAWAGGQALTWALINKQTAL
jgi:hypothetical protein